MWNVRFVLSVLVWSLFIMVPYSGAKVKHRATPEKQRSAATQRMKTVGGFQTATECARCHTDIYRNWQASLHAISYDNPIFTAAYRKAYTETKGEGAKYCLECHAPTVAATGDYDAKMDITKEGVTCDFCHSVVKAEPGGNGKSFELKPGNVKRSARKDISTGDHGVEYSKDFASSRLCAVCHDSTNKNGLHVGNTYDEWHNSPYNKAGTECQNCHMPLVEGTTANTGGRDKIHDHALSHNIEFMKNAVSVETKNVNRIDDELLVDVMIHNSRVGHSIPTGTPARSLVLEVRALDGMKRVIDTRKIVYRKTVVDGKGKEQMTDGDAFLYGEKITSDNRLAPKESRLDTFRFNTRVKDIATVEARAYFFYQPFVLQQTDMMIPLSESSMPAKNGPETRP